MSDVSRAEIIDQLRQFICAQVAKSPGLELAEDEPIITGGIIDSFALAHIAVFIEMQFGVLIPDTDLTVESMNTLGEMADRVLAG